MTAAAYVSKRVYETNTAVMDFPYFFVDKTPHETVVIRKFKVDVPKYLGDFKSVVIGDDIMSWHVVKPVESSETRWSKQYLNMLASFMDNCREVDEALPMFNKVASALTHIPAKEIYVDYGHRERKVDFQLELGNGIHLSVVKPLATIDDNLLGYTISCEGEIIDVGCMDIEEFGIKIIDFIREVKQHV